MIKISMREFTRNVSKYVDLAHHGEQLTIVKRNEPLAKMGPIGHQKAQKWSMEKPTITLKKGSQSASKTVVELRQDRDL